MNRNQLIHQAIKLGEKIDSEPEFTIQKLS